MTNIDSGTSGAPATPAAFVAALKAGESARAVAIAAGMLTARTPLGAQWQSIARFAASEAEWAIAVEAMRRFVLDDPAAVERRLALVDILSQAGRIDEVVEILAPIAVRLPGDFRIRHALGVGLIERGDREAGLVHLRAALAANPGSGATWLALANARRFARGDAEFSRLAAAQAAFSRAPGAERAQALYAFGKALDDLGEHDRAFAAFADGARLVAATRPYDAAADRAAALGAIRAAPAPTARSDGSVDGRAIFVTGKPRSGTTLVEQILSSHSSVVGGGEINVLGSAVRGALGPDGALTAQEGGLNTAAQDAVRRRYAHLLTMRFGPDGRVVDKSLNTSRFARTIRQAMPDAPILWLRRDPVDTAWSSFRTYFAQGVGWSFDLAAMGRYHAIEDALHAYWSAHYGARLLSVDYAALVADPDAGIATLLSHTGLADEAGVRQFHAQRRIVQTASVDQVRQPINRGGLDSAAPYRAKLAPYERAYAEARSSLGPELGLG